MRIIIFNVIVVTTAYQEKREYTKTPNQLKLLKITVIKIFKNYSMRQRASRARMAFLKISCQNLVYRGFLGWGITW